MLLKLDRACTISVQVLTELISIQHECVYTALFCSRLRNKCREIMHCLSNQNPSLTQLYSQELGRGRGEPWGGGSTDSCPKRIVLMDSSRSISTERERGGERERERSMEITLSEVWNKNGLCQNSSVFMFYGFIVKSSRRIHWCSSYLYGIPKIACSTLVHVSKKNTLTRHATENRLACGNRITKLRIN